MTDALKTLYECRNNREASADSGISYSKIASWQTNAKEGTEQYYNLILLEYVRRVNHAEEKKLMEKYGLPQDITHEFLSRILFPSDVLGSFMGSKLEWKRELVAHFMELNTKLLKRQIEVLHIYVRCQYGDHVSNPLDDIERIRKMDLLKTTSHL